MTVPAKSNTCTGSLFYKNTYAKATAKEKTVLLDALEAKYYEKLQEKHGYHNATLSAERGPDQPELSPEIQAEIKKADRCNPP